MVLSYPDLTSLSLFNPLVNREQIVMFVKRLFFHRLLDKTKDLFAAPLCSTDNSKRRRLYSNTCRCAEGEDTYELEADGTIRGNCTG